MSEKLVHAAGRPTALAERTGHAGAADVGGAAAVERLIAVVAYEGVELLDVACVTSAVAAATKVGAAPPYRVVVLTPGGSPVSCDSGLQLPGQAALEHFNEPLDTLVVAGGRGFTAASDDRRLVGHVRRLAALARRVTSICTGLGVLAATGLVDGHRAATHWHFVEEIQRRYPAVHVDPAPIYIREGNLITSAGVTSALDLTLALIEEDHGPELARLVSRILVTYMQRPGDQTQMSMFTTAPPPRRTAVRGVVDHVAANLDGDLSTRALAAVAHVGERQLARLFLEHAGVTPARYVRQARTEAAAHLLEATELSLAAIARRCGFRQTESLRQAFVSQYGTPPGRYRQELSRAS
ncbi:GlxA family transcriptional regulator [Georgenia subflava]|uniref:Helix-turn-helix domain-containing protein n=1 Tax=Georgenia subflava TaxID=1622177 RepID=A0A6N7EFW1_9MICO|nr:helix-turn-helix domain-containing protein [Georgenia subflava]MPV35838.1 helix-turn-helix domain-containing protein [Georgenia subflava]